jgi:two-component system, response regulator YesN
MKQNYWQRSLSVIFLTERLFLFSTKSLFWLFVMAMTQAFLDLGGRVDCMAESLNAQQEMFFISSATAESNEQSKMLESGVLQVMPIEEETVFLEQLKVGNKDKARKALGVLLDGLLRVSDPTVVVPHMFELLAITFRIAAQVADLKKASALKVKLANELRQVDSKETAIAWAEQMLLQYIDLICQESCASASQKVVQKANAYIEENYSHDMALNEIANYVHLSPSYFSRLYKQVTKGNLVDYINSVRIRQAKQLLATTNHDIDYIAFAVGFNTHNYFTTVFRRFEGLTPSEYRLMKIRNIRLMSNNTQ